MFHLLVSLESTVLQLSHCLPFDSFCSRSNTNFALSCPKAKIVITSCTGGQASDVIALPGINGSNTGWINCIQEPCSHVVRQA